MHLANRNRLIIEQSLLNFRRVVTRKRTSPSGHLVEHQAKRKKVGTWIEVLSSNLFWRHVAGGSGGSSRTRRTNVRQCRAVVIQPAIFGLRTNAVEFLC